MWLGIPVLTVPVFLVLGGALIVYAGIVRLTDRQKPEKSAGDYITGLIGIAAGVALISFAIWLFMGR